jgi:type II secretory pathway predicted ATPase ExeA
MYLSHFQLKTEPFSISPNPDFLWLSEKHAAAFETLKEGILNRDGCVLLTGDIGTGKTTLIKRLVKLDDVAAIFVTINDPDLNRLDFCNILAAEFGMNRRFDRRDEFYTGFKHFLLGAFSAYKKVLVIIDEAQRLNLEILQETVELSNLQLAGRKLLKVFFVGQLEFNRFLMQEENRGVLQNITAHYYLEPLTEKETLCYVGHRLKVAGRERPLFTEDAVKEVHALSKGYPRLINIVCDHALLWGFSTNLDEINGRVVRECSRDLSVALDLDSGLDKDGLVSSIEETIETRNQPPPAAAGRGWRQFLYLAAAVAVVGMAFYVLTH